MTSHPFVASSTRDEKPEDNSDNIATASPEQLLVMISRDRTENEAVRVALVSQRSLRLATQTRLSNLLDGVCSHRYANSTHMFILKLILAFHQVGWGHFLYHFPDAPSFSNVIYRMTRAYDGIARPSTNFNEWFCPLCRLI